MSRRAALAVLALLAALAPAAAAAVESPVSGSFELRVGTYRPDDDATISNLPPGGQGPYARIFGSKRPKSFKLHVARCLPWRLLGTFEAGLGVGWWEANAHALDDAGNPTTESTAFKMVPTEATLTWRLDVLWEKLNVPLVPYARASLQRYNWWITGPGGKTSKSGATNGYAYGGGVGLVLDLLDPMLARELDTDYGVNHSMLILDVQQSKVNDFGSASSFDLSDSRLTYSVGLLFVF